MQGYKHKELRKLIERYESHSHMRAMQMNILTIIGLIGFGIFAVPVFTTHVQNPIVTTTVEQKTTPATFPETDIVAREALVYDLATETPLFEKNAHEVRPLASLTKLLTVYGALSRLPSDTVITISPRDLDPDGDNGLVAGETYTLSSLERLALVASSNDAAQAIANAVADRGQQNTGDLLASVATALGLLQTHARNGTGLDVSASESGGYGSAYDVAKLAGAVASHNSALALATTRSSVSVSSLDGHVISERNTNHYIGSIPNPLLSKTGYTDLAGGNLVVVFDAGINHPIAVVVLGSTRESRFSDVETLVTNTLKYLAPLPASKP